MPGLMRRLIYSMGVSLDGYIADREGSIDWSVPDSELHRFHNEQARAIGLELYGRRLYETMRFWETREDEPEASELEREFARIWKATPQVVFSTTLESVSDRARLVREGAVEEVARLKAEGDGEMEVGGAGLAASLVRAGLVDELRPFVAPVVLGGGTPFLPPLEKRLRLELLETRTFSASQVVSLRYRVIPG